MTAPSRLLTPRRALALTVLLVLGGLTACAGSTNEDRQATVRCAQPIHRSALVPTSGAWLGVSIDWGHESLAEYADRVGRTPAVAGTFAPVPMPAKERAYVDQAVEQARASGSMLLLSLEPLEGLDAVTAQVAQDVAAQVDAYTRSGVPVLIRFAHEMNGSWYAWSQAPRRYVRAFRRVATAVHEGAPGAAMMWAPNYGGGYPFVGGRYQARPGSPRAKVLDTDQDGRLTGADDPYAPYWPGREFVDWVGMSLYHWGNGYPWGENEVPEPGKFRDQLRGTYRGSAGDERAVPDFYQEYGQRARRPVAVTETAAFYVPGGGGEPERAVKLAWWQQALAPDLLADMPWLRMVNWFEWEKEEPEVGAVVDWTVTRDVALRDEFVADLPDWVRDADDIPSC